MVCFCVLAETKACETCYNNIGSYSYTITTSNYFPVNKKEVVTNKDDYYTIITNKKGNR